MALNFAVLIILGLLVDMVFRKLRIPGLVGLLLLGIISGPFCLNFISPGIQNLYSELGMVALIVILLRAGFELNKKSLAKVGRRALSLAFFPAAAEVAAIFFLGRYILDLTFMESAILGSIVAAVSPAVVVPSMIHFIEEKKGTGKNIPALLIAASSANNVIAIVVYGALIGIYIGQKINIGLKIAVFPLSIISGIIIGAICGFVLHRIFEKFNPRATKRLLMLMGISIIIINMERPMAGLLPYASLISVITISIIILEKNEKAAHELSLKLSKLWVFAEIILFVLVGSQVNLKVASAAGFSSAAVILLALAARSAGVWVCLLKSSLTVPERIFVVISYIPKATVQAAFAGGPLLAMKMAGMDTHPGEIILAAGVWSIILTAPIGAWAINWYGSRVLEKEY